jgi:hypothetical protein
MRVLQLGLKIPIGKGSASASIATKPQNSNW